MSEGHRGEEEGTLARRSRGARRGERSPEEREAKEKSVRAEITEHTEGGGNGKGRRRGRRERVNLMRRRERVRHFDPKSQGEN